MTSNQADQVAPLLKALGDPVRLRLMSLVLCHQNAEACVCDPLPAFELSQPTISHHLKVLHETGLLNREKRACGSATRRVPRHSPRSPDFSTPPPRPTRYLSWRGQVRERHRARAVDRLG
jgi:DNA-binding transcriptional ArsR family regulator